MPQDEALFRAFQANLLSLISHELRTPLSAILNALDSLGEDEGASVSSSGEDPSDDSPSGIPKTELIQMARKNARRLQQALAALLDLAALESGTFHVRLREVDLVRLIQGRIQAHRISLKQARLSCEWDAKSSLSLSPALVDPQKLSRAVDLCFESLLPRAEPETQIKVRVTSNRVQLTFQLAKASVVQWGSAWSQSVAGFEGGVSSPYSAFAGVMQSEEAFLSRVEEGLGSEFLLIHEIMRVHGGKFFSELKPGGEATLALELPELNSEEGLRAILSSRVFQISTEIGSVGLVLLPVPESMSVEEFRNEVRIVLFRTTDAVYPLPARRQIALVMYDCKTEDAPGLVARISESLRPHTKTEKLPFGSAHCPTDGLDPVVLLELAEMRLELELKNQ